MSPAYDDDEYEACQEQVVDVRESVTFRIKGITVGNNIQELAQAVFPGKTATFDTANTDVVPGAKSGQRIVAKRHGAVFAVGRNRIQVFRRRATATAAPSDLTGGHRVGGLSRLRSRSRARTKSREFQEEVPSRSRARTVESMSFGSVNCTRNTL